MRETFDILTKRLTALGYTEFLSALSPLSENLNKWITLRAETGEPLGSLVDLFLLGQPVSPEKLDPEIRSCIPKLQDAGILRMHDGQEYVASTGLSLIVVFGLWLFHEIPNPRISLYFGDDSVALLNHQLPRRGGTCLDLCSGPGVQALYAAKNGERVTSVEINPMARSLALLNAQLNNLDDVMDIRLGNLYDALSANERFDRITANPPLIPLPEKLPYPFIGHGGNDGFIVTRKILQGIGNHLTENGFGQILGLGLSDGSMPLFLPELKEIASENGLSVQFSLIQHMPINRGAPLFESLAYSSLGFRTGDLDHVRDIMEECYTSQGATEMISWFMNVRHGAGDVVLRDFGKTLPGALWYV